MSIARITAISSLALLSACATDPNLKHLTTTTSQEELSHYMAMGKNTVRGRATFKAEDGKVYNCKGGYVSAVADTAYARERMTHIYGTLEGGTLTYAKPAPTFEPDVPAYYSNYREGACDANGYFRITDLIDGTWYILTSAPYHEKDTVKPPVGAYLMKKVTVSGGRTKWVELK